MSGNRSDETAVCVGILRGTTTRTTKLSVMIRVTLAPRLESSSNRLKQPAAFATRSKYRGTHFNQQEF